MGIVRLAISQPWLGIVIFIWAAVVLYFVYRDAEARDAQPGLWVIGLLILGLFLPPLMLVIGLIAYWFLRPKGHLLRCPHCGGRYLHWLAECPRCRKPLKRDCHRCQAVVPYTSETCPECHARL